MIDRADIRECIGKVGYMDSTQNGGVQCSYTFEFVTVEIRSGNTSKLTNADWLVLHFEIPCRESDAAIAPGALMLTMELRS